MKNQEASYFPGKPWDGRKMLKVVNCSSIELWPLEKAFDRMPNLSKSLLIEHVQWMT